MKKAMRMNAMENIAMENTAIVAEQEAKKTLTNDEKFAIGCVVASATALAVNITGNIIKRHADKKKDRIRKTSLNYAGNRSGWSNNATRTMKIFSLLLAGYLNKDHAVACDMYDSSTKFYDYNNQKNTIYAPEGKFSIECYATDDHKFYIEIDTFEDECLKVSMVNSNGLTDVIFKYSFTRKQVVTKFMEDIGGIRKCEQESYDDAMRMLVMITTALEEAIGYTVTGTDITV